jgi:hypothetical protein
VQKVVVDLSGYGVTFGNREVGVHRHVDISTEPMSYPSRLNLRYLAPA